MKSKKLKEITAIAIVCAIISTIAPLNASAEWLQDSEKNWNWVENGSEATGWKQIYGNWYYFDDNGKMKIGWAEINGNWYYFDGNGSMKNGWLKTSDGKWYDLGFDGAMKTGWVKETDGKWYDLALSGEMKTGWIKDTNEKIYFSSSLGVMQVGIIEVDGKLYAFGENGVLLIEADVTYNGKTYKTDAAGVIIGYDSSSDQVKQFTKEGVLIPLGTSGEAEKAADTSNSSSSSATDSSSNSSSHHSSSSDSSGSSSSGQAIGVISVSLNKSVDTLNIGDTDTLTATISPSNAANKNVSWTSSNENIVAVDTNGKITAVSQGTATITCTTADGHKTASCSVTVNPKAPTTVLVNSVSLNKAADTLNVGDNDTLIATITPANAANKNASWTSSNENIVTVDTTGKITAVSQGTATITCTTADGNKTTSCTVNVIHPIPVTSVTLNEPFDALGFASQVYGTDTLTATVSPDNATNKKVSWSSSHPDIISVDENGKIKAVNGGNATITCTTKDGSKTASCIVAATKSLETLNVAKNTTYDLGVTINKGDLTPAKLKWTTVDNANKVNVTQDGKITAGNTTGSTEIACYYDDDPHSQRIPIFIILVNVTN